MLPIRRRPGFLGHQGFPDKGKSTLLRDSNVFGLLATLSAMLRSALLLAKIDDFRLQSLDDVRQFEDGIVWNAGALPQAVAEELAPWLCTA
mmetsp:Transcript_11689/g.27979  ORF Transcript_11689/g.27979 Transcript_11689/m.27979 type:complete len:91 (-) Transcript_11689:99-371(-)